MSDQSPKHRFHHWLHNAMRGDRYVYHTGQLSSDREIRPELDLVATAAWEAMKAGQVWLFQDTVDGFHDYIAVRTRRRLQ